MMSEKQRPWKKPRSNLKKESETSNKRKYDEASPVVQSFLKFQLQLDAKYDRRERIVKLSRDVTVLSKRLIFQLHRFSEGENFEEKLAEAELKLKEIRGLLVKIAKELDGEEPYMFTSAYTHGVQEFVEAVTFMHYIKDDRLISYEKVFNDYFTFREEDEGQDKLSLLLSPMDYVLGVADLTGELMRMSINCIGAGNHEKSYEICMFLRKIHNGFLLISGKDFRNLGQKIKVLWQSLNKVENACYTLHLRAKEVPKNMLMNLIQIKDDSRSDEQMNS